MEKYAWRARIKKGKIEEYIRRHDAIWEEMKEVLSAAGICNYTIWRSGYDLFGYYECKKGVEYAAQVQNTSPTVARWNNYMRDVMDMEPDPQTGAQPRLTCVFRFSEND